SHAALLQGTAARHGRETTFQSERKSEFPVTPGLRQVVAETFQTVDKRLRAGAPSAVDLTFGALGSLVCVAPANQLGYVEYFESRNRQRPRVCNTAELP